MSCAARWIVKDVDEDAAVRLAEDMNLPLPLCRLLAQRDYGDSASADLFLHPRLSELEDPFLLPDMRKAVERIWQALSQGEKITIHGDYDVDGISSTALLVRVLSAMGGDVSSFIPHRADDGYGLGVENIQVCKERHSTELMITVDCGTGAVEAAKYAQQVGIDLIVTDHHEPPSEVAQALAVVNPKLDPKCADAAMLAGVGVAFKLCHALLGYGRENSLAHSDLDLRHYLDLVALGTVADIVPLIGENRTFVRHGLKTMATSINVGLQALIECAGIKPPFKTHHLGFQIAPRINAAGRIGSAMRALELMLTDDEAQARQLAAELDSENRERRQIEKKVLAECEQQIENNFDPERDYVIVAAGHGWHRGVVGIVASRITRKYYRPSIVIGIEDGEARGSGRSIPCFNLVGALAECKGEMIKFGGHEMAAGLDMLPDKIDDLRNRLNSLASEWLSSDDLIPEQRIDAWLDIEDIGEELFTAQGMLAPFGQSNPAPVWGARGLRFMSPPREVGKGHLKGRIGVANSERDAIGFNMWGVEIPEGPIDVAFRLEQNEFRGRVSYQMNLQALRPQQGV